MKKKAKKQQRLSMKFLREILRQLAERDWANSEARFSVSMFLDVVDSEMKPLKP